MGLFLFLIILLAAAWGLALQFHAVPPAPPAAPIVQRAPSQPKSPTPTSDSSLTAEQQAADTVVTGAEETKVTASTNSSMPPPVKD